ncbi:uncharacterized protein LOC126736792 [Anthonomus grandis grandis]|uniref:uncharacterized protein LOC126736792 n=1 Tax=Anthonomus grandis grandis TaxID=2921223 RepID=UPI0021656E5C|nr:uncharacterized protein LOC126736792 [Anthonomus grandis grandis]
MEEVSIQDWPGPPLDLNSGNNPWMPAYGYQTPNALLEKEDFIGNPDAEYFFQNASTNYMYLETIQEETSDDLRSDSDGESRNSPVGWLATDSEDGSVIFTSRIEDLDCDSDRELACPPKRRRQDSNYLQLPPDDAQEDETSLSRSSSLLQFESLEQQCRDSTSSPNLLNQFTLDLLEDIEGGRRRFSSEDFSQDYDGSVFRSFGGNIDKSEQSESRDSLLYNASLRYSSSSSSDSTDSDNTVENSRSCDNLKTWRSFDNLPLSNHHSPPKKFSSENLSEDSGYGDQLLLTSLNSSYSKTKGALSSSAGHLDKGRAELESNYKMAEARSGRHVREKRNSYVGFGAYDCDVYQNFNNNNFGISYQDLTRLDQHHRDPPLTTSSSPLTDAFLRKKHAQKLLSNHQHEAAINLNIKLDINREHAKFSDGPHAASVPDLLHHTAVPTSPFDQRKIFISVPKDLNFVAFQCENSSVAEKDWNLADLVVVHSGGDVAMANYKREGSYSEAMTNRVDLSDDENSLLNRRLPKHPIVDFDKKVLKAISEQSIQSLISSTNSLHKMEVNHQVINTSTPVKRLQSCAVSTPNLNRIQPVQRAKDPYFDDDRRKSTHEISAVKYDTSKIEEDRNKNILLDCSNSECEEGFRRKGSIIKSSTSTSGMSDIEEKYQSLKDSVRSFSGSSGSKGVHFSPVVAEVNWRDDVSTSTVTPDRESLYSLNSSSPEPLRRESPKLLKPRPQYPNSHSRRSVSQPDLSDSECKREFIDSLNNLRRYEAGAGSMSLSKSQPDVSKFKRRGSQLIKKDKDGCTVKAYVDVDGVQYKHTHLDLNSLSQTSLNDPNAKHTGVVQHQNATSGGGVATHKNSFTSKFPLSQPLMPATRTNNTEENKVASAKQSTHVQKQSSSAKIMATTGGTGAFVDSGGAASTTTSKRKNKSGLGGFLQRLASFRLGAKKGQDQKDKVKRKVQNGTTNSALAQQRTLPNPELQQQNPSYIYIPLKGPPSSTPSENNNVHKGESNPGAVVVAAKPPLPKQPPPRVVHASVKKAAHASASLDERRRRRTIDSAIGSSHGVTAAVPRGVGDGSMDGPMGLIETDLDTEVTVITNGANAKARSLLDLGVAEPRLKVPNNPDGSQNGSGRPHKSMEFLLDKQNLKVVEPPENELQKTERVMSEHELRVQRSLQKLTVPDWYKNSQIPGQGFLLKKNQQPRESRWTGTTGSKTTSLSSLGSGTQSPLILSPTPTSQPFVRWSTSKLNSTASSPCQSTRSSFNQGSRQPNGSISPSSVRSSFSYRQPYLGWRSQERLNRPRTPAERLASTLLTRQPQENPEIQTSIKEVTSAIVHYVSGLKPSEDQENSRSSSVSPRGSQKLCWLESSFVGTKPLDSPETPVTCSESPVPPPTQSLRLELQNHNLATLSANDTRVRPSPSSTTLEDVLDSLLGLPPSGRATSPCLQETVSASTSPQRRASDAETDGAAYRRRSEGSEPAAVKLDPSLPAVAMLRCRYSRCNKTALPTSKEARSFKNCHNCSYTYCSRTCRRSHWERHRKTCLFSRMGTLCRQVIQAVRDQKDTLRELSKVGRRGYISHGLGAVKCFYPNPEAAEKFLADGLQSLGELTFVRWQDLLPTEMGPMLYKELVEMCQNYNPETKFVLYISLCVISETPASGAVKWERQLVSRCAKLRLSKDLNFVGPELAPREIEPPETLILTCPPIRLPTPETSMRARLIAFNNLQAQLRDRGVSLKRQYPEIYKQIDEYCEDLTIKPVAQTIYPRNATTNKSFMCIIMLESDLETLKQVEKAGVKVRTVDCLLSCETTTNM